MPEAIDIVVTRILLASAQEKENMRIADLLAGQPQLQVIGIAEDGVAACRMAVEMRPDVVLLDEGLAEMDGVTAAETIWLATPQVSVILLSPSPQAILRRAMRAGVKEILATPLLDSELLDAFGTMVSLKNKRQTREFSSLLDPRLMPRIIAVSGAKGGIGKTTLSTNLAVTLAQQHPGQVVLLDLHAQYGDVPLMLDLHPKRSLMDMLPSIDDIDEELMEGYLTEHKSGLKVLVSSTGADDLNLITARNLGAVLNCLKRKYRLVVVDVPCVLYEATHYALTHATAVLLVANLFDLTTLLNTRQLLEVLRKRAVPMEHVHLVLNRVERRNRLNSDDVQQALGRQACCSIPEAANIVVNAINDGAPFVLSHPESPVSRSVQQLARLLVE